MFRVFVNDGSQEIPNDDIMYIVCKEGIYLKKKLDIMESITKVDAISTLEPVNKMARMHIPRLPVEKVAAVLAFLRAVYDKHKSEGMVLIFFDKKTKQFAIIPPKQKVSGASISYERDSVQIEGYDLIGTIHSHANFSAFHSGTDHDDETSFDGLHITFGHVASDDFSLSVSLMSNGQRFYAEPSDYLEGIEHAGYIQPTYSNTKYWKWDSQLGKLVEVNDSVNAKPVQTAQNARYKLSKDALKHFKFNEKWMDFVEYGYTYTSYYGAGGYYNRPGYYNRTERFAYGNYASNVFYDDFDEYGDLYDWYYGTNRKPAAGFVNGVVNGRPINHQPVLPINSGKNVRPATDDLPVVIHDRLNAMKDKPKSSNTNSKVEQIEFPKHHFLDHNKCIDCIYRDHKLDWAFDILCSSRWDKSKMPVVPLKHNRVDKNDVVHPDDTLLPPNDDPEKLILENAASGDFLDNIDAIDLPTKSKKNKKRRKKHNKLFKW